MFLSTLRGMRQRWQPRRTSSTQCWESRQPSAEKRLGGKSGSSSFVPRGASGRPGARTDDAGQLGTRSEPGIKAIVPHPGDVDRRSGAPYRASGARLQRGRGFATPVPKVHSPDGRANAGQVVRGAAGGLGHRRTCLHGPSCAVGAANP